jgi:anti-sigma B factor antagonist
VIAQAVQAPGGSVDIGAFVVHKTERRFAIHASTQSYCDVGLDREPDATIVNVSGEMDLFAAPTLASALHRALEGGSPVIVDLSDCSFFESAGLNALLSADLDPARGDGGFLVVRPPSSCADRVLSLTVPGHFHEHDSRDAALAAVGV